MINASSGEGIGGRATPRFPTIRDVAASAGVSLGTVSRVLNGKMHERISEATRLKVLQSAHELSYEANSAARALRSHLSNALAFAVAEVIEERPVPSQMVLGAAAEAGALGQALIVFAGDDALRMARKSIDARRADGLIIDGNLLDESDVSRLTERAVVVQDRAAPLPANLTGVLLDGEAGREALMQHVASLGHTSIAYLGPAHHTGTRLASYRRSLVKAGIGREREAVYLADWSIESAARVAERILTGKDAPTAIICGSDVLEAGVYQAAARLDIRIPEDLSVAAFVALTVAIAMQPQLTAVSSPAEEAGRAAVRLLLDLLQRSDPASVVVPFPLAVRGSTAPPRS